MAKLSWAQIEPTCSGRQAPNYDHCQEIIDYYEFAGSDEVVHKTDEEECKWWYWDVEGGNCFITHCWGSFQFTEDDEVTGENINYWTGFVKKECGDNLSGAGGSLVISYPLESEDKGKSDEIFSVYNDEKKRGGDEEKRSLAARFVAKNTRSSDGFASGGISREGYYQFLNDTTEGGSASREHARRDNDGDEIEAMEVVKSGFYLRNPDEYEVGPRMASGDYTYESTEGSTFSVTTSVSIGAAWNIFTASAGIETSQEDSWEISESVKFTIDCDDKGQVTFYPYYDYYQMLVEPGKYLVDVWVPVVTGGLVTGEIAVDCVG